MEPPITGHDAIGRDDTLVHNWRVSQLMRLGIPGPIAEIHADRIGWHQVVRLVQRLSAAARPAHRPLTSGVRIAVMTVHGSGHEDVACRDAEPDLFFPIGTTGAALRQMEEAKRTCRDCRVQIQCLAWALGNGVTDCVWGGSTPDERRGIRSLSRTTTTTKADGNDERYPRQSAENMAYVRRLLREKQPGFSAALELALMLAEPEQTSPDRA